VTDSDLGFRILGIPDSQPCAEEIGFFGLGMRDSSLLKAEFQFQFILEEVFNLIPE
jgi:hypothetical protein